MHVGTFLVSYCRLALLPAVLLLVWTPDPPPTHPTVAPPAAGMLGAAGRLVATSAGPTVGSGIGVEAGGSPPPPLSRACRPQCGPCGPCRYPQCVRVGLHGRRHQSHHTVTWRGRRAVVCGAATRVAPRPVPLGYRRCAACRFGCRQGPGVTTCGWLSDVWRW